MRGPGNWDDGAGGLVIHCGDVVQHLTPDHGTQAPPTWQPAGKRIARRLYVAAYPEPRPADEAADRGEAAELIELFQRFAWTDPGNDPELMAGLAGCALLAGALRIRPVTWIVGPKGSGKSSIFKAIETLAGDGAIGLENATEPGIRKLLESKRVARAVLLDEIEAREDNARLDPLIEMARVSYDRDQGRWVRGGADGHAGKIDAIFSFASVEPPPVRPQDASRHVVLELRDLRVGEADIAAFDAGMERIKALAARLRRRMLTRWIEVGATALAIVRRHLVGHGLEPRAADTFAPVLAANFAMLSDDAAPAEIDLERWARVLASRVASSASETTGERVWMHLVSRLVPSYSAGERKAVGEFLKRAVDGNDDDLITAKRYGLTLHAIDDGVQCIAVADRHAGLEEVFAGTHWRSGGWRTPLGQLEGALRTPNVIRFGAGVRQRATLIPVRHLKGDDDAGADDEPAGDGAPGVSPEDL